MASPSRNRSRSQTPQAQATAAFEELQIVIRFATNIPDLPVTLEHGPHTTVAAIKKQIRTQLPDEYRSHGLRLIYGGKVLADSQSMIKSMGIKLQLPQGLKNTFNDFNSSDWASAPHQSKWKGKEPIRNADPNDKDVKVSLLPNETEITTKKYYVHCSLSAGPLSPSSLQTEFALPSVPPATDGELSPIQTFAQQQSSTEPQPIGFDRLLTAANGFTREDIATLRAQFRANITSRHTPESMPSAQELLEMEERWLDAGPGSANNALGNTGTGRPGGGFDDEEDAGSMLYDTLIGSILGFFWPLGALSWGLREEGVWSSRRQLAVMAGVLTNVGFGFLRLVN